MKGLTATHFCTKSSSKFTWTASLAQYSKVFVACAFKSAIDPPSFGFDSAFDIVESWKVRVSSQDCVASICRACEVKIRNSNPATKTGRTTQTIPSLQISSESSGGRAEISRMFFVEERIWRIPKVNAATHNFGRLTLLDFGIWPFLDVLKAKYYTKCGHLIADSSKPDRLRDKSPALMVEIVHYHFECVALLSDQIARRNSYILNLQSQTFLILWGRKGTMTEFR